MPCLTFFLGEKKHIYVPKRSPLPPVCRDPVVEMLAKMGRGVKISQQYPHPESKSFRNTCLPQGRPIDIQIGVDFLKKRNIHSSHLLIRLKTSFIMLY